jgi:hypothetical protein
VHEDVVVVHRGKPKETLCVKIHIQWGENCKNPLVQTNMPIGEVMNILERRFHKPIKRRQIPRPDDDTFQEGEEIIIEDEGLVTLEADDLSFKVRVSDGSDVELMRKIKSIWWPMPEDEEVIRDRIRNQLDSRRIQLPALRLRPGSVTREIVGRFPSGLVEWSNGPAGEARLQEGPRPGMVNYFQLRRCNYCAA